VWPRSFQFGCGSVPIAPQLVRAPIICACTRQWLLRLGWRIWSRRSRRSHTLTKPRPHRLHSERCPYRSRDARAARARDLPLGQEGRVVQRGLADPVHRLGRQAPAGALCACSTRGSLWTRRGLAASPDCQHHEDGKTVQKLPHRQALQQCATACTRKLSAVKKPKLFHKRRGRRRAALHVRLGQKRTL
jgi:hypothetical protein